MSLIVYVCVCVYMTLCVHIVCTCTFTCWCVCVSVCVQVIRRANDVQYGLCASENSGLTHRVAQAMNVRTAQLL